MFEMPDSSNIPSIQERVNKTANEVAQDVVNKMTSLDTDIVLAIALIADGLCRVNILSREGLIAQFHRAHEARLAEWKNGHSHLSTLADYLQQAGEAPVPSDDQPSAALLTLIEGGLSQKKSPSEKPNGIASGH